LNGWLAFLDTVRIEHYDDILALPPITPPAIITQLLLDFAAQGRCQLARLAPHRLTRFRFSLSLFEPIAAPTAVAA
jgi:hypothetical protein